MLVNRSVVVMVEIQSSCLTLHALVHTMTNQNPFLIIICDNRVLDVDLATQMHKQLMKDPTSYDSTD